MACPRCGDVCRCNPEPRFAKIRPKFEPHFEPESEGATTRASAHGIMVDPEARDTSEEQFEASLEDFQLPRHRFVVDPPLTPSADVHTKSAGHGRLAAEGETVPGAAVKTPSQEARSLIVEDAPISVGENAPASTDVLLDPPKSDSWRSEVAARLHRYHSRRKPRAPRYPSLRLKFDGSEVAWAEASRIADPAAQLTPPARSASPAPLPARTMSQVLATRSELLPAPPLAVIEVEPLVVPAPLPEDLIGNLIEFPRWNPGPPAPLDELAEPVIDRPRIVEAPEVTPLAPALGGILIESAPQPEIPKQPGIDLPLQAASLERRLLAAALDALTVGSAFVLFAYVFFRVSAPRLPLAQMAGAAAVVVGVLWAAYQYLFLVHTATTPGLRLTRLELCRFDGTPAGQRIRRWRVLVSLLSAASLGLGYAWYFLDEDALCWHDRITHTYLGSVARPSSQ